MPKTCDDFEDDDGLHGDDADDDRDAPQERDLEPDDGDESPAAACPACGEEMSELADRCPSCGEYVNPSAAPSREPPWLAATVVLVLLVLAAMLMRATG